jgi:hypothetical protein
MRKVLASEFVSLDGVVESPEKWHFPYFNTRWEMQSGRRWTPLTPCSWAACSTRSGRSSGRSRTRMRTRSPRG